MTRTQVGIVGAGPAGLLLARLLAQAGIARAAPGKKGVMLMNRIGPSTSELYIADADGGNERKLLPTSPWPRLSRFREHTIELPVAELHVGAKSDSALHAALARALDFGKGLVHVLPAKSATVTVFSTKRSCPSCGRSFAELDPRLFSFNSKHGWCPGCYGTGLKLDRVEWDKEREKTGTEDHVLDSWVEWLELDEACPQCHGKRLNKEALAVRFRGPTRQSRRPAL